MAYKSSNEILERLRSGNTSINSVNRQMLRWFNKRDIDKWCMWSRAKALYLMESTDDPV